MSNLNWHRGGRIVVVWKSEDMNVDILTSFSQLIHISVHPRNKTQFYCTFVYGSSDRKERLDLFHQLHDISKTLIGPWLIIGDFNTVANLNERHGLPVLLREIQPIRECMANCDVHDLHYNGCFYTWNNKQVGDRRIMSKIDRVHGNVQWEEAFPNAIVSFLPGGAYDHSPMLIQFTK